MRAPPDSGTVVAMRFETVVEMPSTWSGVHRHVAVHLFQDRVTVEQMDELDAIGSAWRRKHPGKLVELVVIFPSGNQMTAGERSRMTALMKRWESDRVAAATVILAEGLMGSLHRSVLTGLVMLVPPSHPARVFGKVGDAVHWLVPHVEGLWRSKVDEAGLLGAVETYCSTFERRTDRPASLPPLTTSLFPPRE